MSYVTGDSTLDYAFFLGASQRGFSLQYLQSRHALPALLPRMELLSSGHFRTFPLAVAVGEHMLALSYAAPAWDIMACGGLLQVRSCGSIVDNSLYRRIYGPRVRLVRRRSPAAIIQELARARTRLPLMNVVEFFDDDFTAAPLAEMESFATAYRERVGLPFRCCVRPQSVTPEKAELLVNAGLVVVEMGLQSASPQTNRLYRRPFDPDAFIAAARTLSRPRQVRIQYDIILDNPWETHRDIASTFRFLAKAPPPSVITPFSLTFLPGTELHAEAVRAGLLGDAEDFDPEKRTNVPYEDRNPYHHVLLYVLRKAQRYHCAPGAVMWVLTLPWVMRPAQSATLRPFWQGVLILLRLLSPSHVRLRLANRGGTMATTDSSMH